MSTFKHDPAFNESEAARVEEIRKTLRELLKDFNRFTANLKEVADSHRWDTEEFLGIALETERRLQILRKDLGKLGEGLEGITYVLRGRSLELMIQLEADPTGEGAVIAREVLIRAVEAVPFMTKEKTEHDDAE